MAYYRVPFKGFLQGISRGSFRRVLKGIYRGFYKGTIRKDWVWLSGKGSLKGSNRIPLKGSTRATIRAIVGI